jgi:tetratricopeptide (TPR) repeat protein
MYFWDTPLALHHLRRAIELNPEYARARRFYAAELRNHGRFEEALSEVRLAQQLDPFDEPAWIEEIIILYLSGRHDEAVATAERLLEREQGYAYVQIFVALANIQQAKFEEALAVLDAFDGARVQPDALCLRGYIYAVTDRGFEALRILDELDKQAGTDPAHLAFSRAVVYLAMGEQDMAFDALDQAATSRDWRMRLLKVEPLFEPLHSDSRFSDLLEKVGLREDVGSTS